MSCSWSGSSGTTANVLIGHSNWKHRFNACYHSLRLSKSAIIGGPIHAILFFLSEVYNLDDSRWQAITFDWSILGWKERSMNAEAPLVAVVTMPDQETICRLQEQNVAEIVDWSNKSSAQQIVDIVLRQLEHTDALVA